MYVGRFRPHTHVVVAAAAGLHTQQQHTKNKIKQNKRKGTTKQFEPIQPEKNVEEEEPPASLTKKCQHTFIYFFFCFFFLYLRNLLCLFSCDFVYIKSDKKKKKKKTMMVKKKTEKMFNNIVYTRVI